MNELNKTHIKNLITHFYQRIQQDDLLGPIFNNVAQVNWEEHIPLLCQFWNSIMLKTNEYNGNAMLKHIEIHRLAPLAQEHFEHWLQLFKEEAHKHLPAEAAALMIERAKMISVVNMWLKMLLSIVSLLWAGMILGIMLESVVKFRAPGLTKAVGLEVGRAVFKAFHKAQIFLLLLIMIIAMFSALSFKI